MTNKRVALVTGANTGIGFQIAKDLAAKGLTVFVGSRDSRTVRKPRRKSAPTRALSSSTSRAELSIVPRPPRSARNPATSTSW